MSSMQCLVRLHREHSFVALAAIALAAVALATGGAFAHEGHGKPARLQTGTCDDLGGVAFELTGVGASTGLDDAPITAPEIAGAPSAVEVLLSQTTVAAALADVVGGHAIVVYESDEAMDEVVACGDVGGPMLGEDLVVGLREHHGSGLAGIAVLSPDEAGTGTLVTIYLGEGLLHGDAASPVAGDHDEGDDHDEDGDHD
jgi:hypothetical protein